MQCLIWIFTACLQNVLIKFETKWKTLPTPPKIGKGLILLIRVGRSIQLKWVNIKQHKTFKYVQTMQGWTRLCILHGVSCADSVKQLKCALSYDVASGGEITPCIKINKALVFYRFSENVMKWRLSQRHIYKWQMFSGKKKCTVILMSYDK